MIRSLINKLAFLGMIIFRRFAYVSFGALSKFIKPDQAPVILCYHGISTDSWRFSVDLDMFQKQINHLLTFSRPITLTELNRFMRGEINLDQPSFVVTFDDGYRDLMLIKDYLPSLGIYPTVFALSDTEHSNRVELDTNRPFLNREELLSLKQSGWEIGCHSATHPDFSKLNPDRIREEVLESKMNMEKDLGMKIDYFAYPKGRYTKEVLEAVSTAGFQLALTMDDAFINTHTNRHLVPRIGVDRTHKFVEFLGITSVWAVKLRKFLRKPINA